MARQTVAKKSRNRTPPFANYQAWSEAKFWGFIRSALRNASSRWPPKFECLKEARRPYSGGGRQKWEFQCAECKDWFKQKDISVDHIVPTGSLSSYADLAGFVERMFVGIDGMQVLCTKKCHQQKTNIERSNGKS